MAVSAKESAQSDQASQEAKRMLIPPTSRSCFLASSVTTLLYNATVSQALGGKGLNNIDPHHQPRGHGGGPEDGEVGAIGIHCAMDISSESKPTTHE